MRVYEAKLVHSLVSLGEEIRLDRPEKIVEYLRSAFEVVVTPRHRKTSTHLDDFILTVILTSRVPITTRPVTHLITGLFALASPRGFEPWRRLKLSHLPNQNLFEG